MPLIIDANRSGDFSIPLKAHAEEILRRVAKGKVTIVVGGLNLIELSKTQFRSFLAEGLRSGRIKRVEDTRCDERQKACSLMKLTCNDAHILGLAQAAGCRLLYTDDAALIADFKESAIISPRGKVIMSSTRSKVANSLLYRYGG